MPDIKTIGQVISDFEQQLQSTLGGKVAISWVPENIADNIEMLKLIMLNVTHVNWEMIMHKTRKRHVVVARHLFCWFAHHKYGRSKSDLMRMMGIDHTTVIHAINTVNDQLETNEPLMCDWFNKISKQVSNYEESKIKPETPAVAGAGQ